MNQRMGRPSEDTFKQQCSSAGITCNKSHEDDHGWDFLVEIPMPAPAGTPDDKLPPVRSVLVQVKSTRAASPRATMKVSNAHQLARRSEPCFLVLFHKVQVGERIYARLFGDKDITRTLKRGRKLFIDGTPTNKAGISFGFSASEEHTSDLLQWLVATVQGLSDDYGSEKRNVRDTVGYGDRNFLAKLTFVRTRGVEDFVDLELGLKDQLEVSKFTVLDKRFGIEAPYPIHHHEGPGKFRMEPTQEIECTVTLKTKEDSISIPSKLRSSVVPGTEPKQVKLAILNPLFHIVIGMDEMSFSMRDVASKKFSIADLSQLATLLSWNDERVEIRVTGEDMPALNIPAATVSSKPNPWDPRVACAIRMLGDVALRSQAGDITLSVHEVLSAYAPLVFYFDVLEAKQCGLRINALDASIDHKTLHNLLGYVDVTVGDYTFLTLFDCAIETRLDQSGSLLVDCGPRNVRDCLVGGDTEVARAKGQAIYEQCGGGYGDDWLAVGSVNAIVE